MRSLLVLTYLFFCLGGYSQRAGQKNALFTVRGNVGIPKIVSSKKFRTSFAGIYEANLSVNVRTFSNFYMGVGYQNTQFQNNKFLKQKTYNNGSIVVSYNTRLLCHGIFFKIGYDKFFSEKKGYFSYSINTGYMVSEYRNLNADTTNYNRPYPSIKINAIYIQPEVSANFIVDDKMSFSLMLSYTSLFSRYDARAPRFNQFEEIRNVSNKYLMAWLNFGVGFQVLINRK